MPSAGSATCALAVAAAPAVLVTFDEGFHATALAAHGVQVMTPDELLVPSFEELPAAFMAILERQAAAWSDRQLNELLAALGRAGATGLAERARGAADA